VVGKLYAFKAKDAKARPKDGSMSAPYFSTASVLPRIVKGQPCPENELFKGFNIVELTISQKNEKIS